MRAVLVAAAFLSLALPGNTQVPAHPTAASGGQLVPGWEGRTDRETDQLGAVSYFTEVAL